MKRSAATINVSTMRKYHSCPATYPVWPPVEVAINTKSVPGMKKVYARRNHYGCPHSVDNEIAYISHKKRKNGKWSKTGDNLWITIKKGVIKPNYIDIYIYIYICISGFFLEIKRPHSMRGALYYSREKGVGERSKTILFF